MKRIVLFAALLISITLSVSVGSAQTPRLQPYLTGLSSPVLVTSSKDGTRRLFVVQQRGIIKVVQPGSDVASDFMNITAKVSSSGSERGLLGLTFHPQFGSNSYFFVNYTRASDGATIVARYTAINNNSQGDPNSEIILLTIPQPFSNHNGGMVDFRTDSGVHNLYIGMGDGGSANDPGSRSQNINELLGKMLRITPSTAEPAPNPAYTNPPDNPYVGVNGADEIYAIGLRNPWRWSFDRGGTNQLWAGDVGQNAIEEISVITRGANYGWRVYEGNTCTNLDPNLCAGGTNPITHTPPVTLYNHTGGRCSVTGGYVYRGARNTFPLGTNVYADYCTGEIFTWQNNQQAILLDTPRNISSFGEDDDGELYVVGLGGTVERIVRAKASADFDGDLRTDTAVFRPSVGTWYLLNSSNNAFSFQTFGTSGDIPAPEDFDGDNKADYCVFRPSDGTWYYLRSSNNTLGAVAFGTNGDVPAAGDYDGDAKADISVFRPSNGVWYRLNSSNDSFFAVAFGTNGDIPVANDYDGDGKYDVAVFRPSNGDWYRLNSANNGFAAVNFGLNGDIPVPGDYDGDGRSDVAVFRNGDWYSLRSATGGTFSATAWGTTGDIPVQGDYDGDNREDLAVFRAGVWYILRSSNGSFQATSFGTTGDLPAPRYDAP